MAQILILGGGVGGLVAARTLRKALSRDHRVILAEREGSFVFAPSLLWLMTGGRTAERISRPLARLKQSGIEWIQGEVERIDPARREATISGQTWSADHLLIALGAELSSEAIPGLPQSGHDFYTLPGALALRSALEKFQGGNLVILTASPSYKCPAAPYKAPLLLEAFLRKRRRREATQIHLYAAEPGPLGVAGPEVSQAALRLLRARGIHYHPEHQVTQADPVGKTLTFANGARASFDLLAYVPPHRAPRVVRDAGLVGDSGWVQVDRRTLQTGFKEVYALGDVTSIPLSMGKPLPKAGVFAHAQAKVVARNIVRAITGRGAAAAFDGAGQCFLEAGDGKAAFVKGNFYAEPVPAVKPYGPGWRWHLAKVLFERQFLRRWV